MTDLRYLPRTQRGDSPPPFSAYCIRRQAWARAILGLFVLFMAVCISIPLTPCATGNAEMHRSWSDMDLYLDYIAGIRGGESFYDVADRELREYGFPTASVFNWRFPVLFYLCAAVPPVVAKGLLVALAGITMICWLWQLAKDSGTGTAATAIFPLTGVLAISLLGSAYTMPVVWCGIFIALSLAAYAGERPFVGIALGVTALFFRELAAPFVLVCLGHAVYERRWKELLAWALGLALFACCYLWHVNQVLLHIRPGDHANNGWLALGGLPFVIATCQLNAFLLVKHQWLTGAYLALACLGFAGWNSPSGRKISLVAGSYLVALLFVGNDFNQYWGAVFAPLLCLGAARSPGSLIDLLRSCGWLPRISRQAASAGTA